MQEMLARITLHGALVEGHAASLRRSLRRSRQVGSSGYLSGSYLIGYLSLFTVCCCVSSPLSGLQVSTSMMFLMIPQATCLGFYQGLPPPMRSNGTLRFSFARAERSISPAWRRLSSRIQSNPFSPRQP